MNAPPADLERWQTYMDELRENGHLTDYGRGFLAGVEAAAAAYWDGRDDAFALMEAERTALAEGGSNWKDLPVSEGAAPRAEGLTADDVDDALTEALGDIDLPFEEWMEWADAHPWTEMIADALNARLKAPYDAGLDVVALGEALNESIPPSEEQLPSQNAGKVAQAYSRIIRGRRS